MALEDLKKSSDVLKAEQIYIAARRKHFTAEGELPAEDGPTGIALSGGGIRSAVVCLGVLQALAKADLLKRFDYLSTVSGGGYIGAGLTWWTTPIKGRPPIQPTGVGSTDFPWGVENPATTPQPNSPLLGYLRLHGSYLIPGNGITIWSAIGGVLRGIALNLMVWLPLTVFIFATLLLLPTLLPQPIVFDVNAYPVVYRWLLYLAGFAGCVFLIWSLIYSFTTAWRRGDEARRYSSRRLFEKWVGRLLLCGIAPFLIGTLPGVASTLHAYVGSTGGPISCVVGIATGVYGHLRSPSRDQSQRGAAGIPLTVLAPIAAVLALYGFLLTGWDLASLAVLDPWQGYCAVLVAAIIAASSGWLANLNYISLHRFYRDRLMEAFMPDLDASSGAPLSTATQADHQRLSVLCSVDRPIAPYHLINTNVILSDPKSPKTRLRGGDSFLLSPYYCGSKATGGWISTKDFVDNGMTLPTAMAISGAAVNPDAASDGIGPTRSLSVAILLALLNVRLGYWVGNPNNRGRPTRPNHFRPGLLEFFAASHAEDDRFLQLSDGGHFENLGVYELLRRRARLIVAVDADEDIDFGFSDLQNLLSLAQEDFGTFIDFGPSGLDPLVPRLPALDYPREVLCSSRAYVYAKISYNDAPPGMLVYVKATLLKQFRLQLLGYKDADPSFPDDTTLDQFFDQQKFEAYRELGFTIGEILVNDTTFRSMI